MCIIKHGRSKFDELEKEDKLIIKTFIDKHVPYIRFFWVFLFFCVSQTLLEGENYVTYFTL